MPSNNREYRTNFHPEDSDDDDFIHEAIHDIVTESHPDLAGKHLDYQFLRSSDYEQLSEIFQANHQAIHQLDSHLRSEAARDFTSQVFEPIIAAVHHRMDTPADSVNDDPSGYRVSVLHIATVNAQLNFTRMLENAESNPDNFADTFRRASNWSDPNAQMDSRTEDMSARQYAGITIGLIHNDLDDAIKESANGAYTNRAGDFRAALNVRYRDAIEMRSIEFDQTHTNNIIDQAKNDTQHLISAYRLEPIYEPPPDVAPIAFPEYRAGSQELADYLQHIREVAPEISNDWPQLVTFAQVSARAADHTESWADTARRQAAMFHSMVYGDDPLADDAEKHAFNYLTYMRDDGHFTDSVAKDLELASSGDIDHTPHWVITGHPERLAVYRSFARHYHQMADDQANAIAQGISNDLVKPLLNYANAVDKLQFPTSPQTSPGDEFNLDINESIRGQTEAIAQTLEHSFLYREPDKFEAAIEQLSTIYDATVALHERLSQQTAV